MTIKLYNSKTREKQVFEPLDRSNVRMYVCGPTVYDRAHLGNARPVLVFDVLYRLLRHTYGADHVTYVRNFTDVDDKINAKAAETGRTIRSITDETIAWYHEDMDAIGTLRPTHEPRATEYISHMTDMIETLISDGHAYPSNGHVMFSTSSFAQYGMLSGRTTDASVVSEQISFKKDQSDFVLWKPSSSQEPSWPSPWGNGRPGWHIECSAMSKALLGNTFDIHGGGLDLQFPHHENEIAQSCCANKTDHLANYWLHNEMLQVNGKKMAKSAGNFFTVRDLLDNGISGDVIKYVMLFTHYRKPMDWTEQKAAQAKKTLLAWHEITKNVTLDQLADMEMDPSFIAALGDDLNTNSALLIIDGFRDNPAKLLQHAKFMGFSFNTRNADHAVLKELSIQLVALYDKARSSKDYSTVDKAKKLLADHNVESRFTRDGVIVINNGSTDISMLTKMVENIS